MKSTRKAPASAGPQSAAAVKRRLANLANPEKATVLQRFFKTGPGEYGEGDRFLGITVPLQRDVARDFASLPLPEARKLLNSPIHEHRLTALLIWVRQFERGDDPTRQAIYDAYLEQADRVNNWDLVDLSAPNIVGNWLVNRPRTILRKLARSHCLWERRIAIVATFTFIRRDEFADTLDLADRLLADSEDLLHKATGWMLREVGKRDQAVLEAFLRPRCTGMPRTMLRYAIERFPEALRKRYRSGTFA
jgi:3-methyladenine DNA glycosylase AlkD